MNEEDPTYGSIDAYTPSSALCAVLLRTYQDRYPHVPVADSVMKVVSAVASMSVRSLIATISAGLDKDTNETFTMTERGALKEEIKKSYLFRLEVKEADQDDLFTAIKDDPYRYAGTPGMTMSSGRLTEQHGELVVEGFREVRSPKREGFVRATVSRIG